MAISLAVRHCPGSPEGPCGANVMGRSWGPYQLDAKTRPVCKGGVVQGAERASSM